MAAICTLSGAWDAIQSAGFMSRQQWRAFNLLALCQIAGGNPNMSTCTLAGLWNQVQGVGPFMSEQEFMAESVGLLCQIAQSGGGGGGGSNTNPIYTGAAPPAAPAFPLQGALFTPDAGGAPLQKWIPGTGWVVV